jgi:hypothetical protein
MPNLPTTPMPTPETDHLKDFEAFVDYTPQDPARKAAEERIMLRLIPDSWKKEHPEMVRKLMPGLEPVPTTK